jgi:hypothetical protein
MSNNFTKRKQLIVQAIEDHIADTGRLPSTPELIERLGSPAKAVREDLDDLEKNGTITAVYKAPKNPSIYVPTYMYNELRRGEKVPLWISSYRFKKSDEIEEKIHSASQQLHELKQIERLLYSTGRTLEDAVGDTLKMLDVDELDLPFADPDSWDISFRIGGMLVIADIKGKSKWADKPDVAQLQQWLLKFVDQHPDVSPEKLQGLLIINHFKHLIPTERWPTDPENMPVSEAGLRYLQVGGLSFLTTFDLFQLAQGVINAQISKEKALEKLPQLFQTNIPSSPSASTGGRNVSRQQTTG